MLHSIQVVWLTCCLIILSQYCCGVEMIRENGYFRKLVDEQYIKLNNSLNHLLVNNLYTNLILPKSETTCSRDLGHLILGIIQKKSWALQWLDASAHPPAGITGGAMHWTGSYDVCLTCAGYNTTGGLQFQGSYCTMVFYLNISVPIVPQLTTTLGLCMPNSCTSEEVRSIVNTTTYLLFLEMSQNESFCHRPVEDVDKDTWYYIAVSACSILTILVVNATVIDLFLYTKWCRRNQAEISYTGINHIHEENSNENLGTSEDSTQRLIESDGILYNENQVNSIPSVGEKHNQTFLEYRKSILERYPPINVVCAFSLPINSVKLYAQHIKEDTEKDDGSNSISLTFLDGIRFLSMIWIIAAHILLHGYKLTNNLKSLAEEFQHVWLFGIYFNGHLSSDVYFFMSGLLMCYICLQRLSHVSGIKKRIQFWSMVALHRFIRLTPAYLLTIVIFTGLLNHIYDGPFFPQDIHTPVMANCRNHWYILYLNNLIHSESMCLKWSWYIANDIQFTIILAPIFITLLMWKRIAGVILAFSLITTSCAITYVVAYNNSYNIMQIAQDEIYVTPYTRCGTYMIGMLTGWLLNDFPRIKIRKMLKNQLLLGLCGCLMIACLCILPIFGSYGVLSGILPEMSQRTAAFYLALERVSFTLGLAILVYLCAVGWAKPIYNIFAWSLFRVPARLTYCAYLIHPIIVTILIDGTQTPFIIDQLKTVQLTASITVFSYVMAYIVSMTTEYPVAAIENYLRH